ncbi:MAG: dihydrofolate reductase [Parcubacteria group bacterium Athens0714_25]|nr:MAG: dihydrofolate reductase [Parcubacteria group bacterium Athens0714_25]
MRIIIIAAIAQNGVIGTAKGEMPWHVKEEFAHFKSTTLGSPIIMGRKTFETLGKPLKGRLNIIVTRSESFPSIEETLIQNSLLSAIDHCNKNNYEKIFIIGGREIYTQAIPLADEMILSFMKFKAEGEILFPEYDENDWRKTDERNLEQFSVVYFVRKGKN